MINIQEEILKSIEVMIDKSLNKYNSTRTEDAIVESIKNGKYQVTVDGTKCYVYDSVGCSPKVGNAVWVQIPNGNIHNAFITGRKNKSADGFFNGENTQNGGSSGGSSVSGTGTKDYNELNNKPSINGKTLLGNIVINSNDINYKGQQTVCDKLDELTNSIGSNVTVTQLTTQGTHIATIDVDGNSTDIIAPIPSKLSELTSDVSHRLVTDEEKNSWNSIIPYGNTDKFNSIKDSLPVGASFDIIDDYDDNDFEPSLNNNSQYKEEETVIGTFLNKPLYRKAYKLQRNITSSFYVSMTYFTNYAEIEFVTNAYAISTKNKQYSPCVVRVGSQTELASMAQIDGDSTNPVLVFLEYTKVSD